MKWNKVQRGWMTFPRTHSSKDVKLGFNSVNSKAWLCPHILPNLEQSPLRPDSGEQWVRSETTGPSSVAPVRCLLRAVTLWKQCSGWAVLLYSLLWSLSCSFCTGVCLVALPTQQLYQHTPREPRFLYWCYLCPHHCLVSAPRRPGGLQAVTCQSLSWETGECPSSIQRGTAVGARLRYQSALAYV